MARRTRRAWLPALVASLTAVFALGGCAVARELIEDRGTDRFRDGDSYLFWLYQGLAPLGGLGFLGSGDRGEPIVRFAVGLVPVAVVVFLLTWLSARSLAVGSSALPVALGAWLGTVLGTGLGAMAAFQVSLVQSDFDGRFPSQPAIQLGNLQTGLYWGLVAGFALGLVALLTWVIVRPRATVAEPASYPATASPSTTDDGLADSGARQPR